MKNTASDKSKQEIRLDDILSLNIYQLVIIFFLSIQLSETVRYSLLQDVNKYLFSNAKLSASSFYNTLDRLEKLGLVEMTQSGNERVKSVKGTPKIRDVLQIVSMYATFLSFNPGIIFDEYLPIFESFVHLGTVKNILFIDFDEFFDIGFTSLLNKHTEEFFILADNDSFEKYKNRSNKPIYQTQVINGKIREPDKIFDAVYIVDFHTIEDFYGMNEKELLQEAVRVTKSQGVVIIHGSNELPVTDNIVIDSMVDNLKTNPLMITMNEKSFLTTVTEISPVKPLFYTSKGFLIAKLQIN